jgi:hypothetical protein
VLDARQPGIYGAETADGTHVVLTALAEAEVASAEALVRTSRDHLVHALEIIEAAGARWLVTEDLKGTHLSADFAKAREASESLDSAENVRTLLRIADVVAHLQAENLWHGRIRPQCVLVSTNTPLGKDRETPIVLFGESATPPYRSPERAADAPGSLDDDTWAVAVIAFELLTGRSCPESGFASEEELAEQGVLEQALRNALYAALGSSVTSRRDALRPLRRALARHFVHRADDGSLSAGVQTSNPPPLPGPATSAPPAPDIVSAAVARPTGAAASAGAEKRRFPALAITGLVVGLGVAWALKAPLSPSEPTSGGSASAQATPPTLAAAQGAEPAKDGAISINDVAVTAEQKRATGNELATCVAGYLPRGGFENPGELGWVCSEVDAARGSARLEKSAQSGSETAQGLKSMGPLAQVAFAAVQKGCCESPATLSSSDARCAALGTSLAAAGKAVVDGEALESALRSASDALTCAGAPPSSEAERKAFQAYVDAIRRE